MNPQTQPKTRTVVVTDGFVVGAGKPHAVPGEKYDFPTAFARELVASRKAVFIEDYVPPVEEPSAPAEDPDPKASKGKGK